MSEGRKDDQDKLRYDLIPPGPLAELARVYTIGAKKYDDRNWEKGIKWGRIFAAIMRHAWAWWRGEKLDPVDGQHHLASVVWGAFALIEYETTHPEMDDRVKNENISYPVEPLNTFEDVRGTLPFAGCSCAGCEYLRRRRSE